MISSKQVEIKVFDSWGKNELEIKVEELLANKWHLKTMRQNDVVSGEEKQTEDWILRYFNINIVGEKEKPAMESKKKDVSEVRG